MESVKMQIDSLRSLFVWIELESHSIWSRCSGQETTEENIHMKKLIAIIALATFAMAATAGSDCCPSKAGEKKECPAKDSKCPAGGDQKKDESKSS